MAVVRELYGVMAAKGAAGGYVVTSGSFTEEATAFASGRNVTLVDGPKLFGLIQQAKAARGQSSPRPTPFAEPEPAAPMAIACSSCSKVMVRRVAKRRENAGRAFLGCTDHPVCRGTRPLEDAPAQKRTANLHG